MEREREREEFGHLLLLLIRGSTLEHVRHFSLNAMLKPFAVIPSCRAIEKHRTSKTKESFNHQKGYELPFLEMFVVTNFKPKVTLVF
jgi:hypothetical protein